MQFFDWAFASGKRYRHLNDFEKINSITHEFVPVALRRKLTIIAEGPVRRFVLIHARDAVKMLVLLGVELPK